MLISFFLFIFSVLVIFGSWYIVQPGERGVLVTLGNPSMDVKNEGFGLKMPLIQSVKKMSVRTQKYEAEASAASKDLQIVSTKIAVNYHLLPESVPKIYQELGKYYSDNVIQPAVQEIVKATTAEFTAEELITKRPQVKEQINFNLKERLSTRNIIVEDISITNFDFSESFNNAIEQKVTAEQLKLKAERDLQRIEVEARQKVAEAEGQAQAISIIEEQLSKSTNYIEWLKVNKWDGKLPSVTSTIPFIDVTSKIE